MSAAPQGGALASGQRRLRVLLFSSLYPSSVRPGHGIFVETRLRELLLSREVEAQVVAPVPWFPWAASRFGARALLAATPRVESRHGLHVQHPRYLLLPKIGQSMHPFAMALGALPTLWRLRRSGFDFDLIDAHFYYPDGVAAALLARWLGKPLVITARGSDLNVFGRSRWARWWMRWSAGVAGGSIGVCRALRDTLHAWGADPARLHVVRNGVDARRFSPLPMQAARAALGVDGAPLLLCVGHLVPVKGQDIALQALARLQPRWPGIRLVLVGDGVQRAALQQQAADLGLSGSVHFAGAVAQDRLPTWYSAADLLVLPSRSEGWANVLLEAMACGTPVAATAVGGTAEVVDPAVGRLAPPESPEALAQAIEAVLAQPPARDAVRAYAQSFDWAETSAQQLAIFQHVLGIPQRATAQRSSP